MFGRKNLLTLLALLVPLILLTSTIAQANYASLFFQGTVELIQYDNGGTWTGTQIGDTFFGSFLYGLTDDNADIGISTSGDDGTDYNFLGAPYSSFISNGITDARYSSVRCGTSDNIKMEDEEPDIFTVLSGSTVELGLTDSWDAHFDSSNEPAWDQGKIEFGVSVISWHDLNWMTDQEFYPVPPNPHLADIMAFYIYEDDALGEDVFCAWGLVDQYTCGVVDQFGNPVAIPAPGAILLATLGAGLVGWLRRRRTL